MESKNKSTGILPLLTLIIILLVPVYQGVSACEACNRLFMSSLKSEERAGSLVAKELLATIAVQQNLAARYQIPAPRTPSNSLSAALSPSLSNSLSPSLSPSLSTVQSQSNGLSAENIPAADPAGSNLPEPINPEAPSATLPLEYEQTEFISHLLE